MAQPSLDSTVDEYFARQYGVITAGQARRAGLTMRMVQYRLETGRWRQLAVGVYAAASAPPSRHQRLAAAVLFHPSAIITGRSAGRMHGFKGVSAPEKPEILIPRTSNARSPLATVYRSTFFRHIATTRLEGFEVTSPAETILAMAAWCPAARIGSLIDDTLITRSATTDEYQAILERIDGGRVRGSVRFREQVAERRADAYQPPTSELERLSRRLTNHPEVPAVSHQHPMLGSAGVMVVDTFIADWSMILEVDGRNYHTRKADFERDRRRDNAAAVLGLIVLRFTWSMVTKDYAYCQETLLSAGKRRSGVASV